MSLGFTLYYADIRQRITNCLYPHCIEVTNEETLKQAAAYDYVCAAYKENYRNGDNFLSADCVAFDLDNDHSEDPAQWFTPEKLALVFADVPFAVHYSRHNGVPKEAKSARPRFHVLFAIDRIESRDEYDKLKKRVFAVFPFFDKHALDTARCFYGTDDPQVEFHDGTRSLNAFLSEFTEWEESAAKAEPLQDCMVPHSISLSPIKEGERNSRMFHLALILLKRYGSSRATEMTWRNSAKACVPPLDEQELNSIWRSAKKYYEKDILTDPAYVMPSEYAKMQETGWDTPVPFDTCTVPPFPIRAFPEKLRRYALSVAENIQIPVDMAAFTILGTLSTAAQGKYRVEGKIDWNEPVNLYLYCVMDPSERKTQCISRVTSPLVEYEKNYNVKMKPRFEESSSHLRILKEKQRKIEKQASDGKVGMEEVKKIAEEIADFEEIRPLQLFTGNTTPEKLAVMMAENNGRGAILNDEPGVMNIFAGSYNPLVDIDILLQGYSCASVRIERLSRESVNIERPALTICLMSQRKKIAEFLGNDTFESRGLNARFLYCMPEPRMGLRPLKTELMTEDTKEAYSEIIFNMLDDEYTEVPEMIRLSPAAGELFEEWYNYIETRLRGEFYDIREWAGKLAGNVLRIAGLLCRAEVTRSHVPMAVNPPLEVSEETMRGAIEIGRYCLEHYKAVRGMAEDDPKAKSAQDILDIIRKKNLQEFKPRDLMKNSKKFNTSQKLMPVLELLCDYGYLKGTDTEYSGKGRRPGTTYYVNPLLFAKKAA